MLGQLGDFGKIVVPTAAITRRCSTAAAIDAAPEMRKAVSPSSAPRTPEIGNHDVHRG
jgi:hypothetical protein